MENIDNLLNLSNVYYKQDMSLNIYKVIVDPKSQMTCYHNVV